MKNEELRQRWTVKPLGKAAEVTMGSSPPGESYNDEGKGVPLINGPVEFSEGDFGLTVLGKFTTEPTRMCRTGDLLLCVRGSTTGRTNIAGFDACIGRGVASIRAKEDQRFLNHFIRTQQQRLFDLGNGSTFLSITQEQLVSVQVTLPPLPEQRRIAAILDKADTIRRKREEGIRLTEELLRSTFLEMFGDPVRNPKSWPIVLLEQISSDMTYGTSTKCGNKERESLPVLRIPNIIHGRINWNDLKYASLDQKEVTQLLLKPSDLLFVRTNGNPEYIGRCAMFTEVRKALFASYLIRVQLRPDAPYRPEFLRYVATMPSYRSLLVAEARTTAGNYNISTQGLRRLKLIAPPLPQQETFLNFAANCCENRERRKAAFTESDALFDSLVQRAFRGEL